MKIKRLLYLSPVWILVVVLGVSSLRPLQADSPSVLVQTTAVTAQKVNTTLETFGVLDPDPDQVLSLSLPHAGLVNRVWVRLGQRVRSGDQLLELITAPDARMQYLQAKSAAEFARRELSRQQRLLVDQMATQSQVDSAKKALDDAVSAEKALQERGQDVAEVTLRAPEDGVITRLDVSQGQRVQSDTTALLIAAERRLIARLGVEPEELAGLVVGTPVTITSVFIPDLKIETTIREIHAMIDPGTQLVEVLAEIPAGKTDHLILGSRIVGLIQLDSIDALLVPRSAVLSDAGNAFLYTVNDGKARRVPVRAGLEIGDLIVISGELAVGDVVVTSGNYELTDGMTVREEP